MYKVLLCDSTYLQTKEVRCLIELQNANIDPSKTLRINPDMANLLAHHGPPHNHNPTKFIVQDIKRNSQMGELVSVFTSIYPPSPVAETARSLPEYTFNSEGSSYTPQESSQTPQESSHTPEGPSHTPQESSQTPQVTSHSPEEPSQTPQVTSHTPEESSQTPQTTTEVSFEPSPPSQEELQPSRLLLKRQSSALLLDAQDMDKVVKEEVVLQSTDGSLFSVQTASEVSIPHTDSESSTDASQASTLSTSSSTSRRLFRVHSNYHTAYRNLPQNLIQIISLHSQPLFQNEGFFTLYQAIEYLLQKRSFSWQV